MAEDGLVFQPSPYDPPLGYSGFDVTLRDKPAARYFDASRVSFPTEADGVLRRQTVEHPSASAPEFHFAAGRIQLHAHNGDEIEMFAFGGQATVTTTEGQTLCQARSTAPILPLSDDPNDPLAILESELEVMLAEGRASWGRQEYTHLDRLGDVPPMTLFVAFLARLEERLDRLAHVESDMRVALHFVRGVRETLQRAGDWPVVVPRWEELI